MLDEEEIEEKDRVKYLGEIRDKRLLFKNHIEMARKNATIILKTSSLMRRNNGMPMENKRTIYKILIIPILT